MLASEKISKAFAAIAEEAEKLQQNNPAASIREGLQTIISIAKHQSDIRGAKAGNCKSHQTR